MTILEIAQKVVDEKSCYLLRLRKDEPIKPPQYDAKPYFTGSKKGWIALDLFTALAICAVAKGLNPENRAKYEGMALPSLISITWKVLK